MILSQNTIVGMDEQVLLYEFFTIAVISFIHLVYNATREVQHTLQIPLFTVPSKSSLQTTTPSNKSDNSVNENSSSTDDHNDESVQNGKAIT